VFRSSRLSVQNQGADTIALLTRLRVLIDIADGRLSVAAATAPIGVGRRQICRLVDAFRAGGPEGLISRKRGRPSNRALGTVFRETVLSIVRERYADFGPRWMVMTDVTAEMPLSQLYATSTRICQSGTPISNRESAGEADGLFDPGSWK
jgi:hypothetical protein